MAVTRTAPKPTNNVLSNKTVVAQPAVQVNKAKTAPTPTMYTTQGTAPAVQPKMTTTATQPANGHQGYLDRNYNGGTAGYIENQNKRYADAVASGDVDLINRLASDAKRVGYSLTATSPQPAQQSLQDQMKQVADMFKQQQDAFMEQQRAELGKARDSSIAELQKAYADAVAQGQMSVREAEEAFKAQAGQIEEQAYLDSQATKLAGEGRGIGNSQQMLGMMASDNAREMNLHNTNQGARDKRIADVRDRINAMTKQRDLDIARLNSEYEYNLTGASAQANQNLLNSLTGLYRDDLNARRDFENSKNLQDDAQSHDSSMQDKDHANQRKMQELGFKHETDIEKLRHNNALDAMAKEFGYDIKKMDKQHLLDLAVMAKEFGYDLQLQNDAQSHDKVMQDDDQAFQSSENAKSRAVQRALASASGYSNPSGSPGAQAGNQNAVNMSESDMYNAIRRHSEQLRRTANPATAPVAPLPGSVAEENKLRRIHGIYN